MIPVVIPLLECDVISRSNILKDLFCPFGDTVIEDLPAVFDNKNQVIMEQKY